MIVVYFFSLGRRRGHDFGLLGHFRVALEEASKLGICNGLNEGGVLRLEAWAEKAGGVSVSIRWLWERSFIGTGRALAFDTWL